MEITMQTNSGAELDCPSPDVREVSALLDENTVHCWQEYINTVNQMSPYDMREALFKAAVAIKFLTDNVDSLNNNPNALKFAECTLQQLIFYQDAADELIASWESYLKDIAQEDLESVVKEEQGGHT